MHAHPTSLLGLLILLPLAGSIINGLIGKRIPDRVVHTIAVGVMVAAAALGWVLFAQLVGMPAHDRALHQVLFPWVHVGSFAVDFGLWLDPLSAVMVLIITNVGALIHLYSVGYMKGDPSYYRFFAYLNLFIFSMLCLVLGDNLLVLFLGWEGVGLCSYLLIGFWFEDINNAKAGKKAFITNRVGDFGFALGMMLLFVVFGTLEPQAINGALATGIPASIDPLWIEAAALLLFVGATGKSAQIPLYVWLPDAMAGPTPVSALIHAATMVTAGVYMIARLNGLFFHAEFASHVVLYIGAATALFAATIGLVQNDIKKVLAYSTVSQLGFMFTAMGAGAWAIGMFHLMTHAFFKACLFLGSGSVISAMHHEQDMRFYGGLRKYMPITFATFMVATLAISGIFPFAGFFSKDEVLWFAFGSARGSTTAYVLVLAAAFCTTFYMFRILWMTFFGEHRGVPEGHGHGDEDGHGVAASDRHEGDHDHGAGDHGHGHHHGKPQESHWTMTVPLVVLAVLSAFAGFLGVPHLLGNVAGLHIPNLLHDWYHPVFANSEVPMKAGLDHAAGLEGGLMALSLGVALFAIFVTMRIWKGKDALYDPIKAHTPGVHEILWNKYYVDELYQIALIGPLVMFSREVLWRIVDEVIIDGAVNGAAGFAKQTADKLGRLQNGDVGQYATVMVGGLLFVLLCLAGYGLW
jgi:NADH-quinone oxidoreductase subunit L